MKLRFLLAFFCLIILFVPLKSVETIAYANEEITKENFDNQVANDLNTLISNDLESYFDSIKGKLGINFTLKEFVASIIRGEIIITPEVIVNFIKNSFKNELKFTILSLINVIVLSIFSSLAGSLSSGFKKESTRQVVSWVIYGTIIATIAISVITLVSSTKSIIEEVSIFLEFFMPVIITLITALGGSSGVLILQPFTIIISTFITKLVINLVIPIFFAITIFTFVGNLSDTVKLDTLSKSFKSIGSWVLGIVFSGLTLFVSIQGIVGASIDTVGVKFSKFALSSYVPILGGYLSEGFDIVMASCVLIKNALGLTGILILLTVMLIPMIKILVYSLAFKLVAGIVEPIGELKVSNLLYTTASNLNLLLASIGGVFFTIFIVILITIGCFNSGVL